MLIASAIMLCHAEVIKESLLHYLFHKKKYAGVPVSLHYQLVLSMSYSIEVASMALLDRNADPLGYCINLGSRSNGLNVIVA